MDLRGMYSRLPIWVLLAILFLAFACSTPSWFPFKKGPPHKAKIKELVDKEVVIIDGREYIKVVNPKAGGGKDQPRNLYVPVDEYLAKRDTMTAVLPSSKEMPSKESPVAKEPSFSTSEVETSSFSPEPLESRLKNKTVIAYFDDRTDNPDESLGDWMAQRLMKELDQRCERVVFLDYQRVKDFLETRGIPRRDMETPQSLSLLNEVFGVKALVVGDLSGPYVFSSKIGDADEKASAIIKVEVRVLDAFSATTLKTLSANNPILASQEKGSFSEEKATLKAMDFTLAELGRQLSRALDDLDWSCRIVKVEGDDFYLNAGKLTGLRVGDLLEVFRPGGSAESGRSEPRIRISAFLGMDASIARPVEGKKPEMNDILKLAQRGGT